MLVCETVLTLAYGAGANGINDARVLPLSQLARGHDHPRLGDAALLCAARANQRGDTFAHTAGYT